MIAATIIVGMLIYPPYHSRWSEGRVVYAGYSWIFLPPDGVATVDTGLLLMQWLGVLLVSGIAWLLLRR